MKTFTDIGGPCQHPVEVARRTVDATKTAGDVGSYTRETHRPDFLIFCMTLALGIAGALRPTPPSHPPDLVPTPAGDCIIGPATPPSEYRTFALVVAIRFLERSAYDTLARLVDPRGGYILLSTFIEEERETPRKVASGGAGGESGGGDEGSRRVVRDKETRPPRRAAAATAGAAGSVNATNKKKPGSAAAALEAATAAATLARWPHASPRDYKKILRRGELARYFGDRHGFEVLEDSVVRLPDGRPVACFLARRVK